MAGTQTADKARLAAGVAASLAQLPLADVQVVAELVGRLDHEQRGSAANQRWRRQVGPAFTQADVARLLGKSAQAVQQDRKLLMLRQPESGRPVYPVFQFDGHRPLAGLAEVIRILSPVLRPESIAGWCTAARSELGGRTPAQALRDPAGAGRVHELARQLASAAA